MKCKCIKCGKPIMLSFAEWVKSLFDSSICQCDTCKEIETWKKESIFVKGPDVVSEGNELRIIKYSPELFQRISRDFVGKRCAFCDQERQSFVCKIDAFENGYLTCFREAPFNDCVIIPISRIERLALINKACSRYEYEVSTPIIGYKGVSLNNGILGDERYIYEIGIPYTEERRDPFATDFQDVYSHFCVKMEDVLFWRDFIDSPIKHCKNQLCGEYRLFQVKGEGHCFENTPGNWVSNRLTLLREVTQTEIYEYFMKHKTSLVTQDVLSEFRNADILPYRNNLTREEINKMRDEYCVRLCGEQMANRSLEDCTIERCKTAAMATFCYLILRMNIQTNCFSYESDEYQFLVNGKHQKELDSLTRLLNHSS